MKLQIPRILCVAFAVFIYSVSFAQNDDQPVFLDLDVEDTQEALPPSPTKIATPEEMPRFPGCEELKGSIAEKENCSKSKMLTYVYKNLTFPEVDKKNGVNGIAVVQFKVSKEGKVIDIVLKRDLGFECGKAALKVIEKMAIEKIWIPGKLNEKPVEVQYTIPIKFKN